MPIINPILSVGPTSTKARNKQLALRLTSVEPPEPEKYIDPVTDTVETRSQEPTALGQMCYVRLDSRNAVMYVVVSIDDELTWKEVKSGVVFRDARTGRPWNPLIGLEG